MQTLWFLTLILSWWTCTSSDLEKIFLLFQLSLLLTAHLSIDQNDFISFDVCAVSLNISRYNRQEVYTLQTYCMKEKKKRIKGLGTGLASGKKYFSNHNAQQLPAGSRLPTANFHQLSFHGKMMSFVV